MLDQKSFLQFHIVQKYKIYFEIFNALFEDSKHLFKTLFIK